jgi:hypothetical protein
MLSASDIVSGFMEALYHKAIKYANIYDVMFNMLKKIHMSIIRNFILPSFMR